MTRNWKPIMHTISFASSKQNAIAFVIGNFVSHSVSMHQSKLKSVHRLHNDWQTIVMQFMDKSMPVYDIVIDDSITFAVKVDNRLFFSRALSLSHSQFLVVANLVSVYYRHPVPSFRTVLCYPLLLSSVVPISSGFLFIEFSIRL